MRRRVLIYVLVAALGAIAKRNCPGGQYFDSYAGALGLCAPCPSGKHSALDEDSCEDCTSGFFSHESGAVRCHHCAKGRFTDKSSKKHKCEVCSAGRFAPEHGAGHCIACFFAWKNCCSRVTGDCHDETAPENNALASSAPTPMSTSDLQEELLPSIKPTSFPQLPFWGSDAPTLSPTAHPTKVVSLLPFWGSSAPSFAPSSSPPSRMPTAYPHPPSLSPTTQPTKSTPGWELEFEGIGVTQDSAGHVLVIPTPFPTAVPTGVPTIPTRNPTSSPSAPPTLHPTNSADFPITNIPTPLPTFSPTSQPTHTPAPTMQPTTYEQELLLIASKDGVTAPTAAPPSTNTDDDDDAAGGDDDGLSVSKHGNR